MPRSLASRLTALALAPLLSHQVWAGDSTSPAHHHHQQAAETPPLPHQHHGNKAPAPVAANQVSMSFAIRPISGDSVKSGEEALLRVTLKNRLTGAPIEGRQVFGWMELRRNAQVALETSCRAKARFFSQGSVTAKPDVDLNGFKLLLLNRDKAIAIVNPHVDFSITQMEGVIPLPGEPKDWALSASGNAIFVSLPYLGLVVAVDAASLKPNGLIETGGGSRPTALMALPDGRAAVELAGSEAIALLDAGNMTSSKPIKLGKGPYALASDDAGKFLFAGNAAGNVAAIDLAALSPAAQMKFAEGPLALAYSPHARLLFIANPAAPDMLAVDPQTLSVVARLPAAAGISSLTMEPEGRYLLALNRSQNSLTVIDTADNRVMGETGVAAQPVEIGFSHSYAYVRGLSGDTFTAIELAGLKAGRMAPLAVQYAAGPQAQDESLARARLVAAAGHGALIANPKERVAYYYMEGMNTPMGTVSIYGPRVAGLIAIDRGFREVEPGIYETRAVIPQAGAYDVPIAIQDPDVVQCFTANAVSAPAGKTAEAARPRLESIVAETLTPQQPGKVSVRVIEPGTQRPVAGLGDVRVLAFSSSGGWQQRKWAREVERGVYAVEWKFPQPGRYGVSFSVDSLGLSFADTRPAYITVKQPDPIGSGNGGPQ